MSTIAYTVIAETESEAYIRAYVDWLTRGHIRDVIQAGAISGTVVRIDRADGAPFAAEARYLFGSREDFQQYETGPAMALRAEGIALFGPQSEHPMRFRRTLGGVVATLP